MPRYDGVRIRPGDSADFATDVLGAQPALSAARAAVSVLDVLASVGTRGHLAGLTSRQQALEARRQPGWAARETLEPGGAVVAFTVTPSTARPAATPR